ncbi:hypothetical protein AK830_g726 [Neonectria ditissima]|uniref:Heterokaryon incompatibility domain-containing protein n=1 Tax=Neonectria ditissima TaxID=78410 RepID=A0A0P7BPS2_9HYPO|nr:hypothetical protein AK830_g726 [Neonectria ditissima]
MDHVQLFSDDLARPTIEIPYICDDNFSYDDLSFLTYPSRVGIDTNALKNDRLAGLKLADAAPFLQAWLWFGLLGETLQVGSRQTKAPKRTSSELFVRMVDGQQILSTARLYSIVSSIRNKRLLEAPMWGSWHLERILACSGVAASFTQAAVSTLLSEKPSIQYAEKEDLSPTLRLLLACQVLCQTILNAFGSSRPGWESNSVATSTPIADTQSFDLVNHLLRQSGWCPKLIQRLPQDIIVRHYLSFLRQTHKHETCGCQEVAHRKRPHVPKHTHPQCQCSSIATSAPDIDATARDGKIILFRLQIGPRSPRELETWVSDPLDAACRYVAISHVRSAGLGNDMAKSLPFCQISLIQSLVDQLSESSSSAFFWLDSLSLPSSRQMRKASLRSAWDVFANAHHVLVLDPPLYLHTYCSPQEAILRLRYSTWKRRLWTLEEGFLAKRLVIRFANRMTSLEQLLDEFRVQSRNNPEIFPIIRERECWPLEVCSKQVNDEDLTTLLKLFVHDTLDWLQEPSPALPQGLYIDREHLVGFLRLGFLAASKFRLLIEDDEYQRIPHMWNALQRVYGEPPRPALAGEPDLRDGNGKVDRKRTFERLAQMSDAAIESKNQSANPSIDLDP